jgi:hypothetical protein
VAVTLEERNEALAEQVAEMALTARGLKKSLAFKEHIIASLKLDRTHEEAAVVAFLRGARLDELAEAILRGEHRREEP